MCLLFSLVIQIIVCVFCVKLGEEKGYSVPLCLLAGFFGGFLALIVILLLPDQNLRQEEMAHEAQSRQKEMDALKARIAQLESLQSPPQPEAEEDAPAPQPAPAPDCAPVVFRRRTDELITCPRCGRRQRGNRNACYSCECPFEYEEDS